MKTNHLNPMILALLIIILQFLTFSAFTQSGGGTFEEGPLMNGTRIVPFVSATNDQTAIVFGGREYGFVSSLFTDIYDSESNSFTEIAMNYPHDGEYVVKLSNGKYFIVGGSYDLGIPAYAHTEIFDPATSEFIVKADMLFERMQTSAAQLTDGRILITCAWYNDAAAAAAEIYDLGSNSFSSAGTLITPRASGTLLPTNDGGAILCGGWPSFGGTLISAVEYYNPVTNTFESFLTDPIEDDPGWLILPVTKPYSDLQLNDGSYILFGYRPGEVTEYGLIKFNPQTKVFSVAATFPLNSITTDGGFYDIVLNKNANLVYLLGVKAESFPNQIGLVTVDLNENVTYYPDELYTLNEFEYLYPSMIYLPSSGKILLVGISTETASYFYATDKTFLITPQFNSAVQDQQVTYGEMKISPNPAKDEIKIEMNLAEPDNYAIALIDLSGRVVFNKIISEGATGIISNNIMLPELPSGLYQVTIHGGSQWFTSSLVISND
jgi:hypothetical protein